MNNEKKIQTIYRWMALLERDRKIQVRNNDEYELLHEILEDAVEFYEEEDN